MSQMHATLLLHLHLLKQGLGPAIHSSLSPQGLVLCQGHLSVLWIKEKDDGVRSAEIIPNHLQLRHSFISSGQHQEHRRDGDRTSDETWAAPGVLALTVSPKGKPRWTRSLWGCRVLP